MCSRTESGRRAFLKHGARAAGLLGAWLALGAHTPYLRWKVYRQRHLLILASKTDPEGYSLSRKLAEVLADVLPGSEARPSRAPNQTRVASLLGTAQMDVAILPRADAGALNAGTGPFAETGPVELRALCSLNAHVLVSRVAFPDEHAYLIVKSLDTNRDLLQGIATEVPGTLEPSLMPHPGALAYLAERDRAG